MRRIPRLASRRRQRLEQLILAVCRGELQRSIATLTCIALPAAFARKPGGAFTGAKRTKRIRRAMAACASSRIPTIPPTLFRLLILPYLTDASAFFASSFCGSSVTACSMRLRASARFAMCRSSVAKASGHFYTRAYQIASAE